MFWKQNKIETGIQSARHNFYRFLDKYNFADKAISICNYDKEVALIMTMQLEEVSKNWFEIHTTINFNFVKVEYFDGVFIDSRDKFDEYSTVAYKNCIEQYFVDHFLEPKLVSDDFTDDNERIIKFGINKMGREK